MKVLSLIPPMTQLNTPYPSTAYLTGFLRSHGFDAVQEDLALALVLGFFTQEGLLEIEQEALGLAEENRSASVNFFLDYFDEYQSTISLVIAFLQGRDSTLAHRINSRAFLPEGPRFASLDAYDEEEGSDSLAWAFGALGSQDRARHLATLYLNDLSDVLKDAVDERFEFVRYGESLASSQPTFTPLASALAAAPTLMDQHLKELTKAAIDKHQPQLVLLSVPFPGAMYAALRIAQTIKGAYPHIHIGLGGGYVNTELRELSDPRIFDFVDFITLDS
ncbi:MAG: radical SAM protein, partial [Polynucleobacter sp. 24-46-87]